MGRPWRSRTLAPATALPSGRRPSGGCSRSPGPGRMRVTATPSQSTAVASTPSAFWTTRFGTGRAPSAPDWCEGHGWTAAWLVRVRGSAWRCKDATQTGAAHPPLGTDHAVRLHLIPAFPDCCQIQQLQRAPRFLRLCVESDDDRWPPAPLSHLMLPKSCSLSDGGGRTWRGDVSEGGDSGPPIVDSKAESFWLKVDDGAASAGRCPGGARATARRVWSDCRRPARRCTPSWPYPSRAPYGSRSVRCRSAPHGELRLPSRLRTPPTFRPSGRALRLARLAHQAPPVDGAARGWPRTPRFAVRDPSAPWSKSHAPVLAATITWFGARARGGEWVRPVTFRGCGA